MFFGGQDRWKGEEEGVLNEGFIRFEDWSPNVQEEEKKDVKEAKKEK